MRKTISALSPYWLWALLSVPALAMGYALMTSDDPRIIHMLVHPSGETSARLLIVTLMATPLAMLLKGWRGPLWLKRNRRYLGVAAFGYALLHTAFYLIDMATLTRVIDALPRFYIWTGWVAFAIFIPLAVTSTDYFMRVLGPRWKSLQRWTYVAAVLTLLHWAALHDWGSPWGAIVHFAPLAALEAYRLWYWYLRPRSARAASA